MRFLSLLILLLIFADGLHAQDRLPSLFEKSESAETEWRSKSKSDLKRVPITFDDEVLNKIKTQSIKSFIMPGIDKRVYEVTVQRVIEHYNGDWSITAYLNNDWQNSFILSVSDGKILSGIQNHVDHLYYEIKYSDQENSHSLIQVDPHEKDNISCGIGDDHEVKSSSGSAGKYMPNKDVNDQAVIDVMIVYTPRAENWALVEGDIQNVINQSMAVAQNTADNANLGIEFRLVHSARIDYTESSSAGTDLRRLTTSPSFYELGYEYTGYMDEVHVWRDEFQADLVAMFIETDEVGGLGWLLSNTEGDPRFGFSLTRVQQATSTTHAHEMGHNMGNAHSRLQESNPAGADGGLFSYSTGWRWNGQDNQEYASVMTYNEDAQSVQIFSNPDVFFKDVATGSYTGTGAPSDNARSMREIKHIISQYREARDIPVVETNRIFNITAGKAEATGSIVDIGGSPIRERGICWGTNPNPGAADFCSRSNFSGDSFSVDLAELKGNTNYYARAYAKNDGGTAYGENLEFKTKDISASQSEVVVTRNRVLATGEQESRIDVTLRNSALEPVDNTQVVVDQDGYSDVVPVNDVTDENGYASFIITHDSEEKITYRAVAEDLPVGNSIEVEFLYTEAETVLGNNYPNPFNNQTVIPVVVPESSRVRIDIFNSSGARIDTIIDEELSVGYYEIPFNANRLSSGVYFYRLATNSDVKFEKMVLLK
ncbi:reprolysin-like metallopeptidase [Rhodohalobacter sp.]|uniref:reprolysin-like metallopeptidase n=1 Tax=Rhodohalobacter sp. TaxID=1974210 RepID=UPI0035689076